MTEISRPLPARLPANASALLHYLAAHPTQAQNIQHLDFGKCPSLTDDHFLILLALCPNISRLTIGTDNQLTQRGFRALRFMERLQKLMLGISIKPPTIQGDIEEWWDGFGALNHLNLQEHVVAHNGLEVIIEWKSLQPFWAHNTYLKRIRGYAKMAEPTAPAFLKNLNPRLKFTLNVASAAMGIDHVVTEQMIPRWCSQVKNLAIHGQNTTLNYTPMVQGCPQLLSLTVGRVTDAQLAQISGSASLRHLRIEIAQDLTDGGIAMLTANVPNLESIQLLECAQLTNAAIAQLITLPHLKRLFLNGNALITDAGVQPLLARPQPIETLLLNFTGVSSLVLERVRRVVSPETQALSARLRALPDLNGSSRILFQSEIDDAKLLIPNCLQLLSQNRCLGRMPWEFEALGLGITLEPLQWRMLEALNIETPAHGLVMPLHQLQALAAGIQKAKVWEFFSYREALASIFSQDHATRICEDEMDFLMNADATGRMIHASFNVSGHDELNSLKSQAGSLDFDYRLLLKSAYPEIDFDIIDPRFHQLQERISGIADRERPYFEEWAKLARDRSLSANDFILDLIQNRIWGDTLVDYFQFIGRCAPEHQWTDEMKMALALYGITALFDGYLKLLDPGSARNRDSL